jgi:hypothetical protein
MPIASGSLKVISTFFPSALQMSAEDDLFAELLGGLSKPYELMSKRQYEYAVFEDGIESATDDFIKSLHEQMEKSKTQSANDIDFSRLNRPVMIHAKSLKSCEPACVKMLEELQKTLGKQGRSLVVFPAHEALSSLGGALARDLRSALKLTGLVPAGAVDSEISEAFCRATKELFEIQLKTPVRFVGAAIRAPGKRHEQFTTGQIELEGGSVSISAMVTLPKDALLPLMKRMSGLPEVPAEMVKNAPAEFANVVGGAARGFLNTAGYALRSPSLPRSFGPESQHILGAADSSTSIEVKVETELGEGYLEIRFYS